MPDFDTWYTPGGTINPDGGAAYVQRDADHRLLSLCQKGSFVFVLTPRQLGKSSLIVRATRRLDGLGVRCAYLDISAMGSDATAEGWYLGLLTEVAEQLELTTDPLTWWQSQENLGPGHRFSRFFKHVVLRETAGRVVVFVDEIDSTLKLNFTDDFFIAIRSFHNARANAPAFDRLSFVLVGCATPSDLIRDSERTPFNVGERVDLSDFTPQEAAPLAAGLGEVEPARRRLEWAIKWTGGHPYLTQAVCREIAADPAAYDAEERLDELVRRLFLGHVAFDNTNVRFVRDMLTDRVPTHLTRAAVRETLLAIRRGRVVLDEERSPVKAHLKLSGVVKRSGDRLVLRNEIYTRVFDEKWIADNLAGEAEPQRPARPWLPARAASAPTAAPAARRNRPPVAETNPRRERPAKWLAARIDPDYFRRSNGLRRAISVASISVTAAVLCWVATGGASAGPRSPGHTRPVRAGDATRHP